MCFPCQMRDSIIVKLQLHPADGSAVIPLSSTLPSRSLLALELRFLFRDQRSPLILSRLLCLRPPIPQAKMKQRSQHMDFNFPPKEGTGIAKLIPHASPECIELVSKLLEYNPDDRLSARQALRHPYFRQLREQDKRQQAMMSPELNMSNGNGSAPDASAQQRGGGARQEDHNSSLPSITGGQKGAGYHGSGYPQGHGQGGEDEHYGAEDRPCPPSRLFAVTRKG